MVYRLAKKEAKVQKSHIVNYLTFNFFSEYSVISIKREDWADEFRILNQTKIINKKL